MSTLNQFRVGISSSICPTSATITFRSSTLTPANFDTAAPLGSRPNIACGFLICKTGGTAWIVAPSCTQVSRTWANRGDAITCANALSGHSGTWFIPTITQLQNPGYCCRTYWDAFSSTAYWSSTEFNATYACFVNFINGNACTDTKSDTFCVRAFRCVTY